jgi:epoxide hydrolase 4
MRNFLRRGDPEQLRRSWYIFAFQVPWLPEYLMRINDWMNAVQVLRGSGKVHAFTDEDIAEYKKAWSQPGAMRAMINWYRAAARYWRKTKGNQIVKVPTLMLWGIQDVALSHRMARLSIDYCVDGKLVFFEDATHWVQRDEAENGTKFLLKFFRQATD